jgi:hypothetical protein
VDFDHDERPPDGRRAARRGKQGASKATEIAARGLGGHEVEPGRSFTWVTRSLGVQATGRHSAEEHGAGSRVSLSIQFTGFLAPLVARMYGGLTERYIATEAQGLKDRCEPG